MTTASTLASYVGAWKLDTAATTIQLHTKAMWILKVKGSFKAIEGSWVTDSEGTTTGALVIDAASVDTGMKKRDEHLKTADFFEIEKFPTFTYTITGVTPAADGTFAVAGTLTVHGQTRPLAVVATVSQAGGTATVHGVADLDRSQWGLDWAKSGAGLQNHLVVDAVFTKN